MNKQLIIKTLRTLPMIFILSCSWYLSSQERIEMMPGFDGSDKLVHLICFGGLAGSVCMALGQRGWRRVWLPILLVSVYGIVDEIHQSYTPGRTSSAADWVADTVGATLGTIAYVVLTTKLFYKTSQTEKK